MDPTLGAAFEAGRASWAGVKLDETTFARRATLLESADAPNDGPKVAEERPLR